MRRKLIAGNWKMQGRKAANASLVQAVVSGIAHINTVDVGVAPPAVYLAQIESLLPSNCWLMAQDAAREVDGAYTGEISAGMLADVGCQVVIVGHSERRSRYGDTDAVVVEKFGRVLEVGLIPVLCVGETLDEREAGRTANVVLSQLSAVVQAHGVVALQKAVLAYEPVWAIGTGRTATPEQAQEIHALLRQKVAEQSQEVASALRILYGGSVKAANAAALFAMPDIDGALVGGASLDAKEFIAIVQAAAGSV
jgi:triosephosphate isomerase